MLEKMALASHPMAATTTTDLWAAVATSALQKQGTTIVRALTPSRTVRVSAVTVGPAAWKAIAAARAWRGVAVNRGWPGCTLLQNTTSPVAEDVVAKQRNWHCYLTSQRKSEIEGD